MAEEYAKARSARNTVSQNNLYESASSEQLSQMGKSAKEASNKREKEIREAAKYGFTLPPFAKPISYDDIEQMHDYDTMIAKAKEDGDPLAPRGFLVNSFSRMMRLSNTQTDLTHRIISLEGMLC